MKDQIVIVFGDPIVSGLKFVGPFEDHLTAIVYAKHFLPNHCWWVGDLRAPVAKPGDKSWPKT